MPKLLRRNIWKSIVNIIFVWLIIYIVMAIIKIFMGELDNQYTWVDFFIRVQDGTGFALVIVLYCSSALVGPVLPDYIFIAPFSLKDRRDLIKKFFMINMLMGFLCLGILFSVFDLIKFFCCHNYQILVACLVQEVILFGILYIFSYLKYFRECNVASEIGVIVISTLWESMLAGILDKNSEFVLQEKLLFLFMVISVILTVILVAYYYVRHFKAMVDYFSDYEVSHR